MPADADGIGKRYRGRATELNKILKSADVRQKLIDMGAEVGGGSASEFAGFIASEIKRYEAIVKDSGAPRE